MKHLSRHPLYSSLPAPSTLLWGAAAAEAISETFNIQNHAFHSKFKNSDERGMYVSFINNVLTGQASTGAILLLTFLLKKSKSEI